MDEEKVVIHNGVEMLESWPQQIEEALKPEDVPDWRRGM